MKQAKELQQFLCRGYIDSELEGVHEFYKNLCLFIGENEEDEKGND